MGQWAIDRLAGKRSWRALAVALLAAGLGGCAQMPLATPEAAGHALMRDLIEQAEFSGAVEVTRGGRVLFASSAGTLDGERPFLVTTPSDSGSLAKPMMAEIVLGLVADGTLSLDDQVRHHVPEFPYADTTLRDLLDHSAQLPDYGAFDALLKAGKPVTTRDLILALSKMKRTPVDQGRFLYCNLCYDTLGLAAERASGKPLAELFRERIFEPSGMRTAFLRPARLADWPEGAPRTIGFRPGPEGPERHDVGDNEGFHGGSNLRLSIEDVTAYAMRWALGGVSPDIRTLAMAQVAGPGHAYTLGNWSCVADRVRCQYTGHYNGFDTFAYWDSGKGITAAFVSNGGLAAHYQTELPRALIAIAEGWPAPMDAPDAPFPEDAGGLYDSAVIGEVELVRSAEGLLVQPAEAPAYPAYPVGPGVYYVPGRDWFLSGPTAGRIANGFTVRSILYPPEHFRAAALPAE